MQVVSGADDTEGDAFLYSINESGDGLEELNRVSLENAGALFDVDPIPELPFVRVQPFEGPTRWGIPLNVQSGQTIAISPLTQVVYNLAVRDGFQNLDRDRVETLENEIRAGNNEVSTGLAPSVTDLYSGAGDFSSLPEEGGAMSTSDPEKILLYRLGLEAVAANEGTDAESVTRDPEAREQSQLSALLDDLSSGVVSGFGRNGFELNSLPYKPLSFIDRYETSLEVYADEYGDQALRDLIDQQTTGEAGPESGNSAFSRFVSRDARCDNTENLDQFFGHLSSAELPADSDSVAGKYSAAAGTQATFEFRDVESGAFGVSSEVSTSTDAGSEAISVAQEDLFTCSLNEAGDGNGGTQLTGLVRFVKDIDEDGELDEVTVFDNGDGNRGVLIANDSGTDYAAFGDVNAQGGWNPDDDQDIGLEAACGENFEALETYGDITVDTRTIGAAEVSNPEDAVDNQPNTSATLNVYIGLLGLGDARVEAKVSDSVQPIANGQIAALISVPDSVLNLNVLESYTLGVYRNDEQLASDVGITLADVDIAGAFNDGALKRVQIDQSDMPGGEFDEVRFSVNAGVLSTDVRTEVHEICYGTSQ
ncbi:hypothetical protein [uncultured Halovibrio sp.]|uniref:hypothetical protein n=1 Tax=uncultured Halovibrio sp. TaxID=985049 RepID=UPI0025FC30BE|nr:hypothetical protein [uncultured Halovibrio sp.]